MEIGIIQRAFELAPACRTVEEVRFKLKREGYSAVDDHLAGASVQKDIKRLLKKAV
jgi:hypothetical protein